MATRQAVVQAAAYYVGSGGYYEKKSNKNLSRSVSDFAANKGSANYTYFGVVCGLNPAAWCAMFDTVCVLEACGGDKTAAKKALWGVYPYTSCNQVFDAALPHGKAHYSQWQIKNKGKPGPEYTPQPGDIIVYTYNGSSRDHTGIVAAVAGGYVYADEGNASDKAKECVYALGSATIYGYVELNLDGSGTDLSDTALAQQWLGVEADGKYGPATKKAIIKKHQTYINKAYKTGIKVDGGWGPETYYATQNIQQGDTNEDVKTWQALLYCLGYDPVGLDGSFGANTTKATEQLQEKLGLHPTGVVDAYTWAKALGYSRPTHTLLKKGSRGSEVKYLQQLLSKKGYVVATDGSFGPETEAALIEFQKAAFPDQKDEWDGECGPKTWAKLE